MIIPVKKLNMEILEWMINTQLGRRNLPPQQRIAVVKKFEKKIQEQAIINKKESDKNFHGNQYVVPSPNGEQSKPKIHTDKELAKLAGVGTGTIARFNRVMPSDNEELDKVSMCQIRHNGKYIKTKQKTEKVFSRR